MDYRGFIALLSPRYVVAPEGNLGIGPLADLLNAPFAITFSFPCLHLTYTTTKHYRIAKYAFFAWKAI